MNERKWWKCLYYISDGPNMGFTEYKYSVEFLVKSLPLLYLKKLLLGERGRTFFSDTNNVR